MSATPLVRHWLGASGVLLLLLVLTGCAHSAGVRREAAQSLQDRLVALAPTVNEEDAQRTAVCAFDSSQELAHEYRVVGPPLFHNFMVNLGLKKRGLCYHWAEDLMGRLQALKLATLDLHWGIARAGTSREHNSVVVTAKGQPFERGIVLDAWRHSGRLYWTHVSTDRYPWEEGEFTPPP